ncbi:hypothetical protein IPO96_02055 [Candidatus Saccharibacteria bacterium]|nr:MAG: hypothetical protein IPO96_02055 [Candidatus Saccharibacteria bacterium]
MVEVSIVCLIYKSKVLAEAVYESVKKYTPKLSTGEAEFFFIANDPTEELVNYLDAESIPYYLNINEHLSDQELFGLGIGSPEYIRRVYQGYNAGVLKAKGQKVVLVNSDNFFSDDWLENLLKYSDYKKVVCSTLIEPGQEKFSVFPFAIEKNFGRTLEDFDEVGFTAYASRLSKTGFSSGGAYMPCLLYRDVAIIAGLYPEGNIAGESFDQIIRYGDEDFYRRLSQFGVEHITAKDSIVYHLKEGEKSESLSEAKLFKSKKTNVPTLGKNHVVSPVSLTNYIQPASEHADIMSLFSKKFTAFIINPTSLSEVENSIKVIESFNCANVETVLISSNRSHVAQCKNRVKSIYTRQIDKAIYDELHHMYGEFAIVINEQCTYADDLLDKVDDVNSIYYFGSEDTSNSPIIDNVGKFIIPKRVIINNIPLFLGYIFEKNIQHLIFDGIMVHNIAPEKVVDPPELQPATVEPLTTRVVKKYKKDGVKGIAKSIANKVKKRI